MKRFHIVTAFILAIAVCGSAWADKIIGGIVTDESGKAVAGASVTLLESKENDAGIVKGSASSGIDGHFKISYSPLQPSIYKKSLHLVAAVDSDTGFITVVNPGATQRVTLYTGGSLTGVVKDPDGRPVEGVVAGPSMFVRSGFLGQRLMDYRSIAPAFQIADAVSDSRGIFTVTGLPIGWETYLTAYTDRLPASKPEKWIGQWSNTQSAYPEAASGTRAIRITFIIDRASTGSGGIAGTLYNASEKPMAGVTVTAARTGKGALVPGENPITTLTAGDGSYRFPPLRPGIYVITVFEAEQPVPMEPEIRVTRSYVTEVPLYAVKGIPIHGRVVDQTTGKGIPGIMVASPETRPTITAKDGSFQISLLPGDGLIFANGESAGYYPKGTELTVPETGAPPRITIKLTRFRKLYGQVRDASGKPVDGAWIQTMWPKSPGDLLQSDSAGNYKLILDERRVVTLIISDQSQKNAAIKAIKLTGNDLRMDVRLQRAASLTGIVKGQEGRAVPNARVTPLIVMAGYRISGIENQVYTDMAGRFKIGGFIPGAAYALRIRAEGYEEKLIKSTDMPKLISGKSVSAGFVMTEKAR